MTNHYWKDDICRKIIEGLRTSCDEIVSFTEDHALPVNAEYLLTVNIAKSILTLNSSLGWPLKIYLEYPAQKFLEKCFPLARSVGSSSFSPGQTVFRQSPTIDRPGRTDVAVLRDGQQGCIPVCAIEVKGFNPPKEKVIDDMRRNQEYFADANTGRSQLQFAVSAMVRSYKSQISRKAHVRNLLSKYAHEVQAPTCCAISIITGKLRDASVDDDGTIPQLIAGVIIFEWQNNPSDGNSADSNLSYSPRIT
ncbi:MAG: hypothetical protein ACK5GZ_01555 [Cyanobium sp.]|jgi:hypothetical protein